MELLKEFFTKRTLLALLFWATLLSLIFLVWNTHSRHIDFFSTGSLILFLTFLVIDYAILMVVFFFIFFMSKREQ